MERERVQESRCRFCHLALIGFHSPRASWSVGRLGSRRGRHANHRAEREVLRPRDEGVTFDSVQHKGVEDLGGVQAGTTRHAMDLPSPCLDVNQYPS